METQVVTQLWMGSVMGVMVLTGLFAWIGHLRSPKA